MDSREASEATPLLQDASSSTPAPSQTPATSASKTTRSTTFALSLAILVVIEFGAVFLSAPATQIQQGIICRHHYPDLAPDPRDDPRCTVNGPVQRDLAVLGSWNIVFALIPGMVMAIPYAMLADRYGKTRVLALCMFGVVLSESASATVLALPNVFPIKLIWLASLVQFIGGGVAVFMSIFYAVVSESTTDENRTAVLSFVGSVSVATILIAGVVVSFVLAKSDWLCVYIGLFLSVLGFMISMLQVAVTPAAIGNQDAATQEQGGRAKSSLVSALSSVVQHAKHVFKSQFVENRNLGLLLTSSLFTKLGRSFSYNLSQYAVSRFGWTWSQASLLETFQLLVVIITTSTLIPVVDYTLRHKLSWSLFSKDLVLVKSCLLILATGFVCLGLAPTSATLVASLVLFGLAGGFELVLRSLLAQCAGKNSIATVYNTMTFLECAGLLISGPINSSIFSRAMDLGGIWYTVPFFFGALLVVLGGTLIWQVTAGDKDAGSREAGGEDDE